MITLDAIREALAAPDPYTRMDQLVRTELAAGRLVKAVIGDIRPIADAVLDTTGLTEDGEEAFLGTLDALTGSCHRSQWYENPPVLPSIEEVVVIPRWARVAFAARCARRVLPTLTLSIDAANRFYPAIFTAIAIRSTESTAYADPPHPSSLAGTLHRLSEFALSAEASAVLASAKAAVASAIGATAAAVQAASYSVAASPTFDIRPFIRRDFDQLARVASHQQWDDDTPVSPDVFGPLWPDGPPPGWPADSDMPPQHTGVEIDLLVGERVRDQVAEDETVNLFNALSRYHLARTGRPLVLDDLRPYLPIRAAVGV